MWFWKTTNNNFVYERGENSNAAGRDNRVAEPLSLRGRARGCSVFSEFSYKTNLITFRYGKPTIAVLLLCITNNTTTLDLEQKKKKGTERNEQSNTRINGLKSFVRLVREPGKPNNRITENNRLSFDLQ